MASWLWSITSALIAARPRPAVNARKSFSRPAMFAFRPAGDTGDAKRNGAEVERADLDGDRQLRPTGTQRVGVPGAGGPGAFGGVGGAVAVAPGVLRGSGRKAMAVERMQGRK